MRLKATALTAALLGAASCAPIRQSPAGDNEGTQSQAMVNHGYCGFGQAPSGWSLFTATPLTDFGPTQSYTSPSSGVTYTGQLYPGRVNDLAQAPAGSPAANHRAAGLSRTQLQPLNALGQVDPVNGVILVSSIGMSNTLREFRRFTEMAGCDIYDAPGVNNTFKVHSINICSGAQRRASKVNPKVVLYNRAQGAQTCGLWAADLTNFQLGGAGYTNAQVQVVFVKLVGSSELSGNVDDQAQRRCLGDVMRNAKLAYPNLKMVFLSSRINGNFGAGQAAEPASYQGGFAVKDLIEDQINGDPTLAYSGTNPVAPWLAWGPYLWANVDTPRADGLKWTCADFAPDGTHPGNPFGENKVAREVARFFATNEFTKPWFLSPTPPASECTTDADCNDGCFNTVDTCITDFGLCHHADLGVQCMVNTDCSCGICAGGQCGSVDLNPAPGHPATCPFPVCQSNAVCGNGVVEPGEECDDANTAGCDGCSSACIVQSAFDCSNLLLDGRFETSRIYWLTNTAFTKVSSPVFEGSKAMRAQNYSGFMQSISQTVNVTAGVTYTYFGYLKTENINATSLPRLKITWLNASNGTIGAQDIGTLGGTNDWTLKSANLTAPTGAVKARVELMATPEADGNGSVWFDKIYLGTNGYCGNGTLDPGEGCDDGNTASCDGCSSACTGETQRTLYMDADHDGFGAGSPQGQAYCPVDDRAFNNTDCLDNDATVHPGATEVCGNGQDDDCAGGDVACGVPVCGNSVLEPGEECDDGNVASCDGCSSSCKPEVVRTWFADVDGDGLGVEPAQSGFCLPASSAQQAGDCDDANPAVQACADGGDTPPASSDGGSDPAGQGDGGSTAPALGSGECGGELPCSSSEGVVGCTASGPGAAGGLGLLLLACAAGGRLRRRPQRTRLGA